MNTLQGIRDVFGTCQEISRTIVKSHSGQLYENKPQKPRTEIDSMRNLRFLITNLSNSMIVSTVAIYFYCQRCDWTEELLPTAFIPSVQLVFLNSQISTVIILNKYLLLALWNKIKLKYAIRPQLLTRCKSKGLDPFIASNNRKIKYIKCAPFHTGKFKVTRNFTLDNKIMIVIYSVNT